MGFRPAGTSSANHLLLLILWLAFAEQAAGAAASARSYLSLYVKGSPSWEVGVAARGTASTAGFELVIGSHRACTAAAGAGLGSHHGSYSSTFGVATKVRPGCDTSESFAGAVAAKDTPWLGTATRALSCSAGMAWQKQKV